jgi:hypothetical protein
LIADLAFSNHEDIPSLLAQPPGVLLVALAVPFQLGEPVV